MTMTITHSVAWRSGYMTDVKCHNTPVVYHKAWKCCRMSGVETLWNSMWRRAKWKSRTYELIQAVKKVYIVSASCLSVASQGLRFMCFRDSSRRLLTFAPPQQSRKQTRTAVRGTPHTKYRDTPRHLTSALNGYVEGNPRVRERYHPLLSPATMTIQQCSRWTPNRGTLVPEPFVLSSAAWHTTVTSENIP
jgi:hypothetical protein